MARSLLRARTRVLVAKLRSWVRQSGDILSSRSLAGMRAGAIAAITAGIYVNHDINVCGHQDTFVNSSSCHRLASLSASGRLALRRSKNFEFIKPLQANLIDINGAWARPCSVESISGETVDISIRDIPDAPALLKDCREFFLVFSSGETPVYRHCETVHIIGHIIRSRLTGQPFKGFKKPEDAVPKQPKQSSSPRSSRERKRGLLGASVWERRNRRG